MNILILNGTPDYSYPGFERYLGQYQLKLHHLGHYAKKFDLRDFEFSHPDTTFISGDFKYILNSIKDADLLVFTSPFIRGRISELTLTVQNGIAAYYQMQHKSNPVENYTRVKKIPLFGAIVMPENDSEEQDILLSKLTQQRIATDLKTQLSFFITSQDNFARAIYETLQLIKYRDAYADVIVDSTH